ncbi:MAG: hypothetical protein GY794_23625 [bacterium]|nr:hypothetical protein [bacterium]
MNANNQLAHELTELETELANRNLAQVPDDLRRNVLADVRNQLHAPRRTSSNFWSFAAAVAACLMLGLNLAIASVSVSDYSPAVPVNTADVDEATRLVKKLLPELTDEQAKRHSMMLTAARPSPLP